MRTLLFALSLLASLTTTSHATIIGFGQLGGSNSTVPGNLGSNATAAGSGIVVSNGTTPNISLLWDSAWDIHTSNFFAGLENLTVGGGAWDNEGSIPRVAQLDLGTHTLTFTSDPGYSLVLHSFDFSHTAETAGTTVWNLTLSDSSSTAVWTQTLTLNNNPAASSVVTVSPNFTGLLGQTYTLTFNRTSQTYSSNGRHAIDNLSFTQSPAGGLPPIDPPVAPGTALADLVNPLVGVSGGSGTGSTVPGACLPLSSIYPSPDTQAAAAGGFSQGSPVVGFSQLHASGSGSSTMSFGNFLVSPRLGAGITEASHASPISNVTARPYAYRARLNTWSTDCTVVPTANCAIYQFDFPVSSDARLNFDIARKLNSSTAMTSGSVTLDPATGTLSGGGTFDGNWNPAAYTLYFYAKVDATPSSGGTFVGSTSQDGVLTASTATRQRLGGWLRFDTTTTQTVRMKIGVSFQSVARAQQYLENEIPAWDIAAHEAAAKTQWNDALSAVQAPGATLGTATRLYSALFHSLIQPRNRTGDPAGWPADAPFWDDQYTMWDTWQSHFPLLTIVRPAAAAAIVNSFAERYERYGRAETAFIQGKDFQVGQGGDEVDRAICDAYVKGIPGIDWARVWPLLQFNAARRTADYRDLGFVSTDGSRNGYDSRMGSGSSTLAFAHGDWCAAQVALGLGHTAEAAALLARSQNWRNVWDANATGDGFSGFVQGRTRGGAFASSSATSTSNFYQGTPWNYSFSIPNDQDGAIELMGGRARFLQRLEYAFSRNSTSYVDFSNEVNLKATALFGHAGRPYLQSFWADVLRQRFGSLTYPGDEDAGAMSSTYFFVSAGFFPSATEDVYYLSGPRLPRLEFNVGAGKTFTVTAENAGSQNLYIQSASLDGQPLTTPIIRHADIVAGKALAFVMGPNPSTWGTGSDFQAPAPPTLGQPLTSPWTASLGSPVIANATTTSPVWGSGPNGADNSAIHAAFPATTLALPGDKITLTATVAFQGLSSPQAAVSNRFAWGLFQDDGSSPTAWPGYLAANDTTSTQSLWRKSTGGSEPYHSTTGATALSSFALATPDFADGTYRLLLTLSRNANGALDYQAALVRPEDCILFAAFTGSDPSPTTFTFNRVGLRAADALNADSITVTDFAIVADVVESVSTPLIAKGAVWKYLDNGSNAGTAWKETTFNDSLWAAGPAVLGGGDPHIATNINLGPDGSRHLTTYFRRTFNVTSAAAVQSLALSILCDDGVVVYINGTEVARQNMPSGPITHLTAALANITGAAETTHFAATALPMPVLIDGDNVIAVEVHQRDATSSDLGFDLEMTAISLPVPPTVTLMATDDSAGEAGADQTLVFTVTRTGPTGAPLNVQLSASGSATSGSDFSGFASPITIPAGAAAENLALNVLADNLAEGVEVATISVEAADQYHIGSPATANATIADTPDQGFYFTNIPDPAKRAPAQDADSDGLSNFLEFAFGLNPALNDVGPIIVNVPGGVLTTRGQPAVWNQSTSNGTDFRVLFVRRKDAAQAGLIYTPQFSGDLVNWENSAAIPTVIADGGEVEAVSIKYPFFAAGKKARYFRVAVTTAN